MHNNVLIPVLIRIFGKVEVLPMSMLSVWEILLPIWTGGDGRSYQNYEIWERGRKKANSQTRGIIALDLPDLLLKPGESYSLSGMFLLIME